MNSNKTIVKSDINVSTKDSSGSVESGPVKIDLSQSGGKISFSIRGLFAVFISLLSTLIPFTFIIMSMIYLRRTEFSDSFNMTENLQTYFFYGFMKVITILVITFIAHSFYIFIFNGNVILKYITSALLFLGVFGAMFLVNKLVPGSSMKNQNVRNVVESVLYATLVVVFSLLSLDRSVCIYDSKRCELKYR
jgi:hypothetical protein